MLFELLTGAIFVGGTIALMLASYLLMRWFTGSEADVHEKDLASSVIFRISALHGLILALVIRMVTPDRRLL
ncbi:hypothetical protein LJR231_001358 [Phyllobacterium sp. LjRoot231]|uniref:hypothetical protein n=1 Tax=Phyllobacterium sp. LjRoot231 TaxID=3342289 RepID=UPI003ECF2563